MSTKSWSASRSASAVCSRKARAKGSLLFSQWSCRITPTRRGPYCFSDPARVLFLFIIFASGSQIELYCPRQWGNDPSTRKRFSKNCLHGFRKSIKKAGTPCVSRVFRLKKSSKKNADAYEIAYKPTISLTCLYSLR